MDVREADAADEGERVGLVFLRLAGEARDQIGRQRAAGEVLPQQLRRAEKFRAENASPTDEEKKRLEFKLPPADKLIKLALLTVFVYVPLAAVTLSAITGIAAFSIGGAGITLGGVASVILSFVHLISGNGAAVFLSMLGLGIAAMGIGTIIAIAFFYITKYAVRSAYKIVIRLYEKIKEGVMAK